MNSIAGGVVQSDETVLGGYLRSLISDLRNLTTGEVATYIPQLGLADPAGFGIAVATADGRLYKAGTWDREVTIQSVSKPFMYGAALQEAGRDRVTGKVGVEPTGESFNSIVLDEENNRPFNPMVNAGAILTASLLTREAEGRSEAEMLDLFSALAGRRLQIDQSVFNSENETGHRNRAIAWLMLNSGMIETDPNKVLDLYFKQCSVLVNCADLAVMACTLGCQGRQPVTGEAIFKPDVARDVLSVMTTCGMYDYAGQWLFDVGLPAKSGVSGMIMAVVPGQLGLAVYSPRLDPVGNSVRGIEVCRRFARDFALHTCTSTLDPGGVIYRVYTASEVRSQRQRKMAEHEFMQEAGRAFTVIELDGPLYFGAAERITHKVAECVSASSTVVLDFRRVESIDAAALDFLTKIPGVCANAGCRLFVTELPRHLAASVTEALERCGADEALSLPDTETALEQFEDVALAAAGLGRSRDVMQLSKADIFAGLSAEDISVLENAAATFSYEAGDQIVTMGEEALAFYVVARGRVNITVPATGTTDRRIGVVGPGQAFGEMAMLDGGRRSANAVAAGPVICHAFGIERIREIAAEKPHIYSNLLQNLVRSLSDRLRAANEQIRTFE